MATKYVRKTGSDSYDTANAQQDEATQATGCASMWTTRNTSKCAGICFFEAFDEIWKAGEDGGVAPTNDGNYTDSYYFGNNDGFYITPDLKGNEQHFGWWRYITPLPYKNPPQAKQVVFTMKDTW